MFGDLAYIGKINKNDTCAICKLRVNENESIVICPTCQILFHEKHLMDWLQNNNKCPVCGHDFTTIIQQHKLKFGKIDSNSRLHSANDLITTQVPSSDETKTHTVYNIIKGQTSKVR